MGYVDSDAHVFENDHTWEYFDPDERNLAPKKADGRWIVGDYATHKTPFYADTRPQLYNELFPRGSVDLLDTGARLRRMDELGIDVQVCFSSWWINIDITDPSTEAALMRSWNRWMAEATADTHGRLLWALQVPATRPERAIEEMRFGKDHGAVAVHLNGVRNGIGLGNPAYLPIYEVAQELDLVIAVHSGGDSRLFLHEPSMIFQALTAPVASAFFAVMKCDLARRFPRLRWAFLESGASWVPFAIQEASRADAGGSAGGFRNFREWRDDSERLLTRMNSFVTCQIDDDISYLVKFVGKSNFIYGTDFGHLDLGSDPYGLQIVAGNPEIDREFARRIVDANARKLWSIDSNFTPAPAPSCEAPMLEPIKDWTLASGS